MVEAAIKQGIYVIIDWHDHSAEQHQEEGIMGGAWLSQDERLKKTGEAGIEVHSNKNQKAARQGTVSACDE